MSLILLSVVFFVGSNNSSCGQFQALVNAVRSILSGYPLFNSELTIDLASILKSSSLLHILLAHMRSPQGTVSF